MQAAAGVSLSAVRAPRRRGVRGHAPVSRAGGQEVEGTHARPATDAAVPPCWVSSSAKECGSYDSSVLEEEQFFFLIVFFNL